jgi:hypothetical protein
MMAGMSEIQVLIVKCPGGRLYPIDFLPDLAETILRGLVAVADIDRIEDQAVS